MTGNNPESQPNDPQALGSAEDMFALLYQELHLLAKRHLHNRGAGYTLGTTTLLHEAFLKLSDRDDIRFPDRSRFLSYASKAMRGLIIDYARNRSAAKRGGEFHLLSLEAEEEAPASAAAVSRMDELSDALDELAAVDPGLAELVDLHFFCGLPFVEIAGLRRVSDRTVQRDWRKAKMILYRTLRSDALGDDPPE